MIIYTNNSIYSIIKNKSCFMDLRDNNYYDVFNIQYNYNRDAMIILYY